MKSSISDFLQAGNPNKALQEHPPPLSFQSKVCSLMLVAVHGTDVLVSLITAMSSWSLHHLGNILIRLLLAVESPFQGYAIRSAYEAVRNLEALAALTPKGFSKASRLTRDALRAESQKLRSKIFRLTAQWQRSGGVWLESHLEVGSILSLPKCIASGKGSVLPGSMVVRHSCWDLPGRPGDCQAFFSRIKYCAGYPAFWNLCFKKKTNKKPV